MKLAQQMACKWAHVGRLGVRAGVFDWCDQSKRASAVRCESER